MTDYLADSAGPWVTDRRDKFGFIDVRAWDAAANSMGPIVARVHFVDDDDAGRAAATVNARLMAAAPDLLAALEELEATFRGTSDLAAFVRQVTRAAIAKARGER